MREWICRAFALIAMLFAGTRSSEAAVYHLKEYPTYQAGYTLTGTVTTDGTIGALTASNILSWEFSATNGTTSVSYDSTTATTTTVVANGVVATAGGELQLERIIPGTYDQNKFSLVADGGYELRYQTGEVSLTVPDFKGTLLEAFTLTRATRNTPLDFLWAVGVPSSTFSPLNLPTTSGAIVLAAIPEPTGLALAAAVLMPLLRRRPRG